jgi:hypothetical protein
MKWTRLPSLCVVAFLTSCAVPSSEPVFSPRLDPQARYVAERRPISAPATAPIRELALSLPVYESKTPESSQSGYQFETTPAADATLLRGDGAQCPVAVKRLSPAGVDPVRLKVYRGATPGVGPANYGAVYELEKVPGGWKILSLREGTADALFQWPMD